MRAWGVFLGAHSNVLRVGVVVGVSDVEGTQHIDRSVGASLILHANSIEERDERHPDRLTTFREIDQATDHRIVRSSDRGEPYRPRRRKAAGATFRQGSGNRDQARPRYRCRSPRTRGGTGGRIRVP